MAQSSANITQGSAFSVTTGTTASITPVGNRLYLLSVTSTTRIGTGAQPNFPTVTGGGITWSAIGSSYYDNSSASRRQISLLRGLVTNPSAGALTIDFAGQSQSGVSWVVDEITGIDTSGTNGGNAIVQSVVNSALNVSSLIGTLASFSSTSNSTYGVFGFGGTTNFSAGAGFTGLGSSFDGSVNSLGMSEWTISNDTTVDVTSINPTQDTGMLGLELKSSIVGTNLVQSTGTANLAAGSTLATFSSNMTAGNLIVVGVTLTNALSLGTVSSVTDNQSNTYTLAKRGTLSEATSVIDEEIWYASKITGGVGTITVNHTTDNCSIFAREYSGFNTLDVTNSATGSSTSPNTGTVTTTVANELLIVSTGDDKGLTQTFTPAGAYGDMVGTIATLTDISMEDNLVSATGAQTGTLTLGVAANWVSVFASFYQSSSGISGWKTLLGVGQG